MGIVDLNNLVYGLIFKHGKDIKYLKNGIVYIEILLKKNNQDYVMIDTYANLLYKSGIKKKAIQEQERALNLTEAKNDYDQVK
jgi:hypothetical protein